VTIVFKEKTKTIMSDNNVTTDKVIPARSIGLDLLRSVAACCVIAVHFSLNSNFYNTSISNWNMCLQEFLRCFFMTCVPIFMMLTGFLNAKKTVSTDYYKGIIKIFSAYFFYTTLAILFRIFYLQEYFTVLQWLEKIMRFSANEYGWYVEMYLGLFLLIPFLNILYQNIVTQKEKQILIVTLAIMTVNTSVLFNFSLLPAFWTALYPITYYFIGSYVKEYKPQIDKKIAFGSILLLLSLSTIIAFFLEKSLVYFYFNSPIVMILAIILFIALYDTDFKNNILRFILTKISLLSLDIYLCSYIFDKIYYTYFKQTFFISQEQFYIYFPVLFGLVFCSAFLVAWLRDIFKMLLKKS
jgi:surface polysaccharide O-acyltransferase-like enzyme